VKTCLQPAPRGFTLIELMVAMAITTIIVTILISITSISLDTWNRSRAEIRAARQAQAMMEIMTRDFEAMVTRPGNNFEWLRAETSASVGPAGNPSPNSAELVFFTAATDRYQGRIGSSEDQGGDISAVGYSLRYNDPINAAGTNFDTFVLYRKLVNPDETFDRLLAKQDLSDAFDGLNNPEIGDIENFVCENIYQFSLTFHIETVEPGSPPRTVPFTLAPNADNSSLRVLGNGLKFNANDALSNGRITAVEVSITVLSDNAMNTLRNASALPADFISKNSFQYSKRIEVPRM